MQKSIAIIIAFSSLMIAESTSQVLSTQVNEPEHSAYNSARLSMLQTSIEANYNQNPNNQPPIAKRNILIAGGLSILYPGLGQAYNRHWIKASTAFLIETGLIIAYSTWQSNGTQGVEDFEAYAVAHWSPLRYAIWLNEHESVYTGTDIPLVDIDFTNPSGWSDADKQIVTNFFNDIRAAERISHSAASGAIFSHVLPYHGEQQYYELIGKYFQYAPGWDDYENFGDPNNFPLPDGSNVSDRFWKYAADHKKANDYLRKASRVTSFFILTRFVAGFDALISAHFNNVSLEASNIVLPNQEVISTATLSIGF